MTFTGELWTAMTPIYEAILRHPFVTGLTDGSLPRDSFRFYAVQDALYLREFARALSLAAARAPEDDWIVMFNEHAAGALQGRARAARGLLQGVRPVARPRSRPRRWPRRTSPTPATCSPSPTARRFTRRWPRSCPATGSTGRSARRSSARARPIRSTRAGSPPTRADEFGDVVRAVLAATDTVAERLRPAERDAMRRHVVTTSRYEWMFWDMGWRRETWPL